MIRRCGPYLFRSRSIISEHGCHVENRSIPTFASATDAAAAIRERKISSVELTTLAFERIDRYNPELNAIVLQFRDAGDGAGATGRQRAGPRTDATGAFHGVPITIKESFSMAGVPTTAGVPAMKNAIPKRNAAAVDRSARRRRGDSRQDQRPGHARRLAELQPDLRCVETIRGIWIAPPAARPVVALPLRPPVSAIWHWAATSADPFAYPPTSVDCSVTSRRSKW